METKKCAFIGATPAELDFGYDEESHGAASLKTTIAERLLELLDEGYVDFVSSLEQGVELWAAEASLAAAELWGTARLIAAPTSDEQASRWHPQVRERYFTVLEKAHETIAAQELLTGCNLLVAVGACLGERALGIIERAKRLGIAVEYITSPDYSLGDRVNRAEDSTLAEPPASHSAVRTLPYTAVQS